MKQRELGSSRNRLQPQGHRHSHSSTFTVHPDTHAVGVVNVAVALHQRCCPPSLTLPSASLTLLSTFINVAVSVDNVVVGVDNVDVRLHRISQGADWKWRRAI